MSNINLLKRFLRASAAKTVFAIMLPGIAAIDAIAENDYSVYVDSHGRMRRSDTKEEVRFYGTNYTLPFAHGYRAINELAIDHKKAIDRDVYHMSRMGANAFRLHLWDAELADSIGNLLSNEHLDLLDYLLSSLENRGISIILTAQTNFGNGYPEKNIDTGAFTYDYPKCGIHENPEAIKAQERYVSQLVKHVNPYTGRSYAEDRSIIAMEINNEPCHQSDARQVKEYINAMVKALKRSGWKKPILYNVSHNMPVVEGYYNAAIDGTTYQWYPIGLVAGHKREGNFLPYVDDYHIPFSGVKGFSSKAKVIYEFDPADMLDSYMFPAVARTFAREGFQWATQFAYDPIDIARYNTEYQTHYLNLAYTPQKAIGMKIAAKVIEQVPAGADYGKYPADTVFGDFTVSYRRNLAQLNSEKEFFHTNNTTSNPVNPDSLTEIAGYGSSPIVDYPGKGAYLIDKVSDGLWRLEIMPDILYSRDPFGKPALTREVAHAINGCHHMTLRLPGLGNTFFYQGINDENPFGGRAENGVITVIPGVYLLGADSVAIADTNKTSQLGNIRLNEFVTPQEGKIPLHVNHQPKPYATKGRALTIHAEAFGDENPDSLIIYPADASFWRDDNKLYVMHRTAPYEFEAEIPASDLNGKKAFSYRIAAQNNHDSKTFPGSIDGLPLDWDAEEGEVYTTLILEDDSPIVFLSASDGIAGIETSTIPDIWGRAWTEISRKAPIGEDALKIVVKEGNEPVTTAVTKWVKALTEVLDGDRNATLVIRTGMVAGADSIIAGVVNADGITFSKKLPLKENGVIRVGLSDLSQSPTLLCPAPYPTFLDREMTPQGYTRPLNPKEIEKLQLVIPSGSASRKDTYVEIIGAWIER